MWVGLIQSVKGLNGRKTELSGKGGILPADSFQKMLINPEYLPLKQITGTNVGSKWYHWSTLSYFGANRWEKGLEYTNYGSSHMIFRSYS